MTQVYNMKGILRAINMDQSNGIPEGFSLEQMKNGQPTGVVKYYNFADLEHGNEIKESLKPLKKDDHVDYQTIDYKPIKIGAPGTVYSNKGGGSWGRMTPEDRRSIERQKALDITARVFESQIGRSESKTNKTFCQIMEEILKESEITYQWIHQEAGK